MSANPGAVRRDLFNESYAQNAHPIAEGATLLHGFAAGAAPALLLAIDEIVAAAPLRHMITPGGYRMSVAMTNCGAAGWVSDRSGYRYDTRDPLTGKPWPVMPGIFSDLARRAAAAGGFGNFEPDACLINRYEPGARLTLHQDKNERDYTAPIVSVSLGLPAVFLFGALRRKERPQRMRLQSGDVAVWGGPTRLAHHGVAPLADGDDPLTGRCRYNLTFRTAL
ncbi:MAG TPA: DNA oxidative demethylase AlkB [Burkholderiales bacterium]|nr:DNA oxidative demethylase AlkB [Burkholderiales bacterium]